jgi:hypothetical protein
MGSGVSRPTATSAARDAIPLESWTANDVAEVLEPLGCGSFAAAVRGTGFNGAAVKTALVRELDAVQQQWQDVQAGQDRERKARRLAEAERQRGAEAQRAAAAAAEEQKPPQDEGLIESMEDLAKTKGMGLPCQVSPPRLSQQPDAAAQQFFGEG